MHWTCKNALWLCLLLCHCALGALDGSDGDLSNLPENSGSRDPSAQDTIAGAPIVDALSSQLSVDKTETIADGTSVITVTATLVTPTGSPAAGALLEIEASGSDNVFSATMVLSDVGGFARATLASTKAEAKTITARVSGAVLGHAMVSFVAGAPSAATSHFRITPMHPRSNGVEKAKLTLAVRDLFDNPVSGVDATIAVAGFSVDPAGPFSGTSSGADGTLSAEIASNVAETKRVSAQVGGVIISGAVRFVDEWFRASGAPFGTAFRCVSVDDSLAGAVRIDVVTESGASVSRDNGKSFGIEGEGLPLSSGCAGLVLDRVAPTPVLYAALSDGRVFKKARDAAAWSELTAPPAGEILSAWLDTRGAGADLWIGRAVSPYTMRFDGNAWVDTGTNVTSGVLAFAQSATQLFAGTDVGVFERTTGNFGGAAGPTGVRALAFSATSLVAATTHGLHRKVGASAWVSENAHWPEEVCPTPCTPPLSALAIDAGVVYASSDVAQHRIVMSRPLDGDTFVALQRQADVITDPVQALIVRGTTAYIAIERHGLYAAGSLATVRLGGALRAFSVNDFAIDTARPRPRAFSADASGLSISDDQGDSWHHVALGDGDEALTLNIDTSVTPSRILVGTKHDGPSVSIAVWQSEDGGDTFVDATATLGALAEQPLVALASLGGTFASDSVSLFFKGQAPYAKVVLPAPPLPVGYAVRSLRVLGETLAIATSAGAFSRSGTQVARIGGDGFTEDVRRLIRTPLGAYWFATAGGLFSASGSSAAALASGAPGRSFTDVVLDDRSATVWAVAEASGVQPAIFTFDAAGVNAPVSVSALVPLGVDAVRLALIPAPLSSGVDTRRVVYVAFKGGAGVYASSY